MAATDVAERYYAGQVAIWRRTLAQITALWAELDGNDPLPSWRRLGDRALVIVASGQTLAASTADAYTTTVLEEQDLPDEPAGSVRPSAFAGIASDGRELDPLLATGVMETVYRQRQGATVDEAKAFGFQRLARIAVTQVQDAGRAAVGTAIAARPRTGYVRMLNPPSCSRCAVLAGKWYRWNEGFQRHPLCDCRHIPTAENARDLTTDPRQYFDSLSEAEQNRIFTNSGAEAIREGADIGQVVNARRGMTAAGTTLEGTTRRGFAGRRMAQQGDAFGGQRTSRYRRTTNQRLMPERIFAEAGSREEAIELLKANGFIV